jgi:hypothetical protein
MAGGGKMTGWDLLNATIKNFSPLAMTIALLAIAVIFVIGFSRNGMNFLKYGFGQSKVDELGAKIDNLQAGFKSEIDSLRTEFKSEMSGFRTEMNGFKTELEAIKVNHFGHLKSYLRLLNGVLLDKNIVDNTMKARLDNELQDM